MKGLLIVFFLVLSYDGYGQSSSLKTPITATDSSNHSTVIEFGVDPSATYCIDPSLGEFELPPGGCTGSGLCIAFKDIHSDSTACLGEGLLLDLRKYYSAIQADTYRIVYNFQNYPVVFRWSSDLGMSYDSVKFLDELGGVFININMLAIDSMVMASPVVSSLLILAWGPKLTSTSVNDSWQDPQMAYLYQNYPNPFNPTTVVNFSLSAQNHVELKVFNALGSELSTLVNEWREPGIYRVSWDATERTAGVYYIRLRTENFVETRKMVLLK